MMKVQLGEVQAHCPNCGNADFAPADQGTEDAAVCELICTECEYATTYAALILQIGPQALHSAREKLKSKANSL
jgi:hypothetical protein